MDTNLTMAENASERDICIPSSVLNDLRKLVWGDAVRDDLFLRWSQGFLFSESEPTALVQQDGGPCGILVPVQAYMIKSALFDSGDNPDWRQGAAKDAYLIDSLTHILCQSISFSNDVPVYLVLVTEEEALRSAKEEEHFHSSLRMTRLVGQDEVHSFLSSRQAVLRAPFAVLSFLYSVVLTKGIEQIKNEMGADSAECLIDHTHGHGSQSMINLILTGGAVPNVFDNNCEVSGLSLAGITHQSEVGFLTLLEHLRYCEVGSHLKSPKFPIWLLASETHLTLLFSPETKLCAPETPDQMAKRVFKSFDAENSNFISAPLLADVMQALDLYAESEYVEMMKKKLDPEDLGIILMNAFMEEFFPQTPSATGAITTFTVFHYNGLPQAHADNKVKYSEGACNLGEYDVQIVMSGNPIQTCLQTKWSGIEVQWNEGVVPSMN